MAKNSKAKGNSYELKTAKLLSEWWGGTFSRVPASGGLHWGSDHRVAGDIIAAPGLFFPFVIECKNREGWTMEHIMLDIGQPREWWSQVVTDARRVKLIPILIFSRNRAKNFIMVPYDESLHAHLTGVGNDTMQTNISFENIRGENQNFNVLVTTYDSFSQVPIEFLKKYAAYIEWDSYKEDYE